MFYSHLIYTPMVDNLEKHWKDILCEGMKLHRPKGFQLTNDELSSNALYFLEKGEAKTIATMPDGSERLICKMRAPSLLGESILLGERDVKASMELTQDSVLYSFSREWVKESLMKKYPDAAMVFIQSLSSKALFFIQQRVVLQSQNLEELICKVLKLHLREKEGVFIAKTELNQQELANFLGVHRVSLNKVLKRLEKNNILSSYHKNEIKILDIEQFERIIENAE